MGLLYGLRYSHFPSQFSFGCQIQNSEKPPAKGHLEADVE